MNWSYFNIAQREPIVLILGVVVLLILMIVGFGTINIKCKDNKIKTVMYLAFIIQIVILVIDNYIKDFPLINVDARAFEDLGWFSYENSINVGRGNYNYLIINPIYKLLGIRVAAIFGAINIYCHILINLNIYKILNLFQIERNLKRFLMYILIISPISLIMRAGILREAIIIVCVSYSIKCFTEYIIKNNFYKVIISFISIGVGAIFHSGVIFLAIGYFFYLLGGKKNQKFIQFLILLIGIVGFVIFKDKLLMTVGGGDIDRILAYNNDNTLKSAGSAYLTSISTTSLAQIGAYLPLFMFYFLYSPTPNMIRGMLDIVTLALNSSIYLYITFVGLITYKNVKSKLSQKEKKIVKSLLIGVVFTIAVFSVGTRNAGTAMRHRDKILPFLIVIFAIIRNKYFMELKYRKNQRRDIGRDLNETN